MFTEKLFLGFGVLGFRVQGLGAPYLDTYNLISRLTA